jgi:hypothetical protein
LADIIDENVQKKIKKQKCSEPWLNKELKNLRNKRNKLHKKLKNSNTNNIRPEDRENYLKLYKDFETRSNLAYEFYMKNLGNR